jgi:tetrahydromethanopterin S-methyltransferase subunit G
VGKVMAKKKLVKKRNPQDSTLRNVKAVNKRLDELEKKIRNLQQQLDDMVE